MKNEWKTKNELMKELEYFRRKVKNLEKQVTEGKKAEARLAVVEQRYRELFENVNVGILRSTPGPEGAFIDVNPMVVKTLEADSREQLLALHPSDIYWDASQRKVFSDAIVANGYANEKIKYKTVTGKPLWCNVNAVKKADARGIVYFDAIIKDITERKRADEELKKSESKFRAIFDNANDGMFLVDLKAQKFFMCNATCAKMLGYPQEEFSNLDIADIHPGEDLPFINEQIGKFSRGEEGVRSDIRFKRKDGSIFEADLSPTLIMIAEKKYLLIIFKDITERKRVEETLRQNEAVLRSMLHATPAGVALLVNRKITKFNRALCLLFGYSEEEFLNQNTRILYPDENDFKRVEEELYYSIMCEGLGTIETQLRRKDGVLIDVLLNLSPFNPSSPDEGLTATVLDITGRKRAEETVKTSLEQMRLLASKIESTREEERKSISREVHDELGQVLTGIRMELEEIERIEPIKNELFLLKINCIYNHLDEAITTVQDISARLRPGMLDDLGLFAAVEWQTDEFQRRSDITCTLELPEMDSTLDEKRSTALFRIFQETLTNVARHAHAKNVDIKLLETNDAFTLTVRDNGIGITENHLKDPRSLGLIGIQERLRPFHGTCTIQTMQDGGTEVQVYLPKEILM